MLIPDFRGFKRQQGDDVRFDIPAERRRQLLQSHALLTNVNAVAAQDTLAKTAVHMVFEIHLSGRQIHRTNLGAEATIHTGSTAVESDS